jgi:ABC-type branched-subunit amino acid transport system ATPase component/branched-subunit amino acid ABC-type transport system permease component
MIGFLQFALLGLGSGAVYCLLAQGIVLTYRASGVVNFAQAAFAMSAAYAYSEMRADNESVAASFIVGVVVAAILGLATYVLVIRPLRKASPLARLIATLGVLTALQAGATLRYGDTLVQLPSMLPVNVVHLGSVVVPQNQLWLGLIAVLLTAALFALFRFTSFGRATSAVAENETAAMALGWSPTRIAAVNWTFGAVLAGVAGILIVPLTGLTVTVLGLLIVPALAAAVLGGFVSFPMTLVGGLLIGILQSEASQYISQPGWPDAIPFLVVMAVLVVRGRALPLRSHVAERLPRLGTGRFRPVPTLIVTVIVAVLIFVVPLQWAIDSTITFITGVIVLSVIVLTGYAGQLSLAQYALAGVGALTAARLVAAGWPFEAAAIVAVLLTAAAGAILGLPALRVRGVNLAVVTLGLGSAIEAVLFTTPTYMGSAEGTNVGPQTIFGIGIDPIVQPRNYTIFALVVLVIAAWLLCNVRSGPSGRRLLAVRTNERAAASLGVNVSATKLYAFAVSAGLAGLAGVVLGFQSGYVVTYDDFSPTNSIFLIALAVIGGIGYVTGAPIGGILASGGIATIIGNAIFGTNYNQVLVLIGGLAVIVMLLQDPDGVARHISGLAAKLRITERLRPGRRRGPTMVAPEQLAPARVRPRALEVDGLTVRFGGVAALTDVSVSVQPGEVVGLIGPNGAGKTTLIDAVTGFTKPVAGSIKLDGAAIDRYPAYRRMQAGLSRSFQSLELFDGVTVLDNIRAATDNHTGWDYLRDLVMPRKALLPDIAWAALSDFRLQETLDKPPEELSYGTRRLVAIARAVATGPSALLLDEPAAGLDESETAELAVLIRRLADVWGIGILVIEHDMQFVMGICDRVAVLDFGRNIATGTPAEIRGDPKVVAAYLGKESADLTAAAEDEGALADADGFAAP